MHHHLCHTQRSVHVIWSFWADCGPATGVVDNAPIHSIASGLYVMLFWAASKLSSIHFQHPSRLYWPHELLHFPPVCTPPWGPYLHTCSTDRHDRGVVQYDSIYSDISRARAAQMHVRRQPTGRAADAPQRQQHQPPQLQRQGPVPLGMYAPSQLTAHHQHAYMAATGNAAMMQQGVPRPGGQAFFSTAAHAIRPAQFAVHADPALLARQAEDAKREKERRAVEERERQEAARARKLQKEQEKERERQERERKAQERQKKQEATRRERERKAKERQEERLRKAQEREAVRLRGLDCNCVLLTLCQQALGRGRRQVHTCFCLLGSTSGNSPDLKMTVVASTGLTPTMRHLPCNRCAFCMHILPSRGG
jgi:hypothetical protein